MVDHKKNLLGKFCGVEQIFVGLTMFKQKYWWSKQKCVRFNKISCLNMVV